MSRGTQGNKFTSKAKSITNDSDEERSQLANKEDNLDEAELTPFQEPSKQKNKGSSDKDHAQKSKSKVTNENFYLHDPDRTAKRSPSNALIEKQSKKPKHSLRPTTMTKEFEESVEVADTAKQLRQLFEEVRIMNQQIKLLNEKADVTQRSLDETLAKTEDLTLQTSKWVAQLLPHYERLFENSKVPLEDALVDIVRKYVPLQRFNMTSTAFYRTIESDVLSKFRDWRSYLASKVRKSINKLEDSAECLDIDTRKQILAEKYKTRKQVHAFTLRLLSRTPTESDLSFVGTVLNAWSCHQNLSEKSPKKAPKSTTLSDPEAEFDYVKARNEY